MKKLLAIVLCTIILAIASPVYAQGDTGYPVDELDYAPCSASYGMGPITPAACVAYYEIEYPDVATGCGEMAAEECVAHYESLIHADVIYDDVVEVAYINLSTGASDVTDEKAGGEGPNPMEVGFGLFLYLVGISVLLTALRYLLKTIFKHMNKGRP